ncbi:hypothetical protein D3C81_1376700 [compost metagenome]
MAALAHHFQHLLPVAGGQVDAGRVVAAGVQHDDRLCRQGAQVGEHAGQVDALGGGVVVAVVLHREAGGLEQRAVVFPARVADGNHGIGQQALEEVGTGLQCAGAAEGLGGDHTAFGQQGGVGTEQQLLHGAVVGGDAFDRQVAARRLGRQAGLLGLAHGAQQRNTAFLGEVHAYAQIDLARAGVGIERFVETQDGVAGSHFDGGEQTHVRQLGENEGGKAV